MGVWSGVLRETSGQVRFSHRPASRVESAAAADRRQPTRQATYHLRGSHRARCETAGRAQAAPSPCRRRRQSWLSRRGSPWWLLHIETRQPVANLPPVAPGADVVVRGRPHIQRLLDGAHPYPHPLRLGALLAVERRATPRAESSALTGGGFVFGEELAAGSDVKRGGSDRCVGGERST